MAATKVKASDGSKSDDSTSNSSSPKKSAEKKSNKGCWIIAAIGGCLFVIIAVMIVGLIAIIASTGGDTVSEKIVYEGGGEGKIAVIRIDGVITESSSSSTGLTYAVGPTSEEISDQIDRALDDSSVKGILIRMNSPGGEVVASDIIYQKVLEARKEKPVVTWMSSMGASGGYLIASGSDSIVAHPQCITGSIGTIMQVTNLDGLYEKLGVDVRTFKSGEFKDDEGVFDEDPEGEADLVLQSLIDESYDDFVEAIAAGRDMEVSEVRKLADGRVYSGQQAYENGLVDKLGDMDDAVTIVEKKTGESGLSVVEYSSGGFWSGFYEYEQAFLEKVGMYVPHTEVGLHMYYVLDIR